MWKDWTGAEEPRRLAREQTMTDQIEGRQAGAGQDFKTRSKCCETHTDRSCTYTLRIGDHYCLKHMKLTENPSVASFG